MYLLAKPKHCPMTITCTYDKLLLFVIAALQIVQSAAVLVQLCSCAQSLLAPAGDCFARTLLSSSS
jgi:hypothetical protein